MSNQVCEKLKNVKLVETSFHSRKKGMKITASFEFSTSHCLTVGDPRTFGVLGFVLSLGRELMSSTLAVKLLWKAAVFDVLLINTLYLYVAL